MSSDSTPKDTSIQLSLFGDNQTLQDKRPLPLIVAERWNFPLQFHVADNEYVYSLQDWVAGLTQGDPGAIRENVRRLLNNADLGLDVTVQKYRATNGRNYNMPFVGDKNLYDIAQALRPLNSRKQLAAVHGEILDYLSKAGAFADKVRRDPKWAATRLEGMVSREQFTYALVTCVTDLGSDGIAIATNDVYRGLYHRTAAQLSKQLDTKNPRDKMTQGALHILGLCEWVCSQQIGEAQSISMEQARAVIQTVAGMLGLQVAAIEKQLGIDLATGKKLISAIEAIKGA